MALISEQKYGFFKCLPVDFKNLLDRSVYLKFRNSLASKSHQMSENAASLVLGQKRSFLSPGLNVLFSLLSDRSKTWLKTI